jgi:predicted metal-dependent hydrolase
VNIMEQHHIPYGDQIIPFEVERKNVKNVNLNIKPDMTVTVSANEEVPIDFIEKYVRGKASWIAKHLGQFDKVQPQQRSEREYVSGESYKYLGRQYRLRVRQIDEAEYVKYLRGFLYLYVKDPTDYKKKETLMQEWYRNRARKIFHESLDKVYPKLQKYKVPYPEIQIRSMKARWGSCLVDFDTIILNFDLIKAPKICIDYVVLHELIHFKNNDHSDHFYKMLYSLMPDWEKRKAILDEETVRDV